MRKGISLLALMLTLTSFAATDYIERGAPAPDHDWYGADMEKMAGVLKNPAVPVPQLSDPESARYFERVVSHSNFSYYRNAHLPIRARIPDFLQFQGAVRDIAMRYIEDMRRGVDLHREVALLMCHLLFTSRECVALLDEFVPTLPKDATYEARMEGVRAVRHAVVIAFSGAEQSLSETNFYGRGDISTLLHAMDECLPALAASFSEADRKELAKKLEMDAERFTTKADKEAILRMIGRLRGMPGEGRAPIPQSGGAQLERSGK